MSKRFLDKERQLLVEVYDTDEIVANPTLDGTEGSLAGLQIGDTKYKVTGEGGGGDIDVTPQELEEYFTEYCDTEAEIEEDNILALSNVELENNDANDQILLVFNTDNVKVENKVLEINTEGGLNTNE